MSARRIAWKQWLLQHYGLFLFLVATAIILLRMPVLLSEPRLWAEEGGRYYAVAYRYSHGPQWYLSLLNVQRGYFALWPNLATTMAANLTSVEDAPYVTTWMALLGQLLPLAIIAWGKADIWRAPWRRFAGVLIYLLIPISGEIWLNTINSQFYFALAAFLALLEPADLSQGESLALRLVLSVAGLTGPVTAMIAPLYVAIAAMKRDRERVIQASILVGCALLQTGLLVAFSSSDKSIGIRVAEMKVPVLAFVTWTQSIGLLLFGWEPMANLASWVVATYGAGEIAIPVFGTTLALMAVALLIWLAADLPRDQRVTLVGGYLLLLILSYLGGLAPDKLNLLPPGNGGRYFWVPNVLLGFLLLANLSARRRTRFKTLVCAGLLSLSLANGAILFSKTIPFSADWPAWRAEIALWRADPAHRIKIWPAGWEMVLTR
jgi:hypothetical protein